MKFEDQAIESGNIENSQGRQIAHREFWAGARAELPILIGVAPFGMIYGVMALGAGLSAGAAQAMSSIMFAGSAQLVAVQLIGGAVPAAVVLMTIFVINLRHALYSASIAPHIHTLSPAWKALLSYLLTDEAYAVAVLHFEADQGAAAFKHWYFLGCGLALWLCWQASTAVGILLGAVIPPAWSLDFTLALTFIALLIPSLKDRAAVAAALSAGFVAVVFNGLPLKLGLILAALAGIIVGLWVEKRP